ncbi:Hypp8174 [Branchiostoma lanceolatum]|uniref:Hypp8174 protein n=1 Tax=Branchiostoma lanceolatum TaxID=7740 RepID=A0A8J9Z7N6_BRALA|nr:Hypp8174 [Branchiostoma lanceolatum]
MREPFYRLFSIHAFLQSGDDIKNEKEGRLVDYEAVLAHIKSRLPTRAEIVECVVDFEEGMWRALPLAFLDVPIKGCAFYWTQTVWKKAQKLGLRLCYTKDEQSEAQGINITSLDRRRGTQLAEQEADSVEKGEAFRLPLSLGEVP